MPRFQDEIMETEYEVDTMSTTIFRKPKGHKLSPSNEMRSIYVAGTDKPNAEADDGLSWNGLSDEVDLK